MSVYLINNMIIRDRQEYGEYVRAFMPIFKKYQGEIIAVQDNPVPLEGNWPYSRTVLLRMPSAEKAREWYDSPEYRAIAVHRWNSTESNAVLLEELVTPRQPKSDTASSSTS